MRSRSAADYRPDDKMRYDWAPPAASARPRMGTMVPASRANRKSGKCVGQGCARFNTVETAMRISARNQIKGTVVDVTKGATTSHVRVDIGNGQIVTSSITNEAVDDLGIKAKGQVTVVIKASDVMIAVA
jgi:molybdopterin-binding protein